MHAISASLLCKIDLSNDLSERKCADEIFLAKDIGFSVIWTRIRFYLQRKKVK